MSNNTPEKLTDEELDQILQRLKSLTGDDKKLLANLGEIEVDIDLDKTNAKVHCYYIKLDGNGEIREKTLAKILATYALDYAIPSSVKHRAMQHYIDTGSMSEVTKLHAKARGLFTSLSESGEGGELLLYMLAHSILKLPQLLCKMPLKTSADMHYHGADGIHGYFDKKSQKLKLFWGESKLHASTYNAIYNSIKDLAEYLLNRQGSDARGERDLELMRDNVDLNDKDLESALIRYFDPENDRSTLLEYCGICLAGFNSEIYPEPLKQKTNEELGAEFKTVVSNWLNTASNRVIAQKLDKFDLHIFCVPFKSVETFREALNHELGKAL